MKRMLPVLAILASLLATLQPQRTPEGYAVKQVYSFSSSGQVSHPGKPSPGMVDIIHIEKGKQRIDSYIGNRKEPDTIIDDMVLKRRIVINWAKRVYAVEPEETVAGGHSGLPSGWIKTNQYKTILGYKARLYKWFAAGHIGKPALLMSIWVSSILPTDVAGRNTIDGMYLEMHAPQGKDVQMNMVTTSIKQTVILNQEFDIPSGLKRAKESSEVLP